MKILVLSDRFVPEVTAPSVRITDHARVWMEKGHEVTVVTCVPNTPRGIAFDGYENKLHQEEWIEGIRTIRLWSYMTANEGFVKRTLDYTSFMVSATLQSPRFPDFDVLLATSPPLFTALGGYFISRIRRRPWVFEIRDLWPASIKAVGASGSSVIPYLEKLELFLYRKADRIISLTHSFKQDLVDRGIPSEKNDVITNSVDLDRFNDGAVRLDVRAELGVSRDIFLAGYIGTTGMAHGLGTILDAAEFCLTDEKIRFLIMGEGAERLPLEKAAQERGLSNVIFHDFVPHQLMPSYLAALDASIVHLRPDPLFRTVIPSKIFEAMAMGKPLLMGVEGESADIVSGAEAGICFPSGNPGALAQAARQLSMDVAMRERLGENGRRAAHDRYGRRANAEAVIASLEAAITHHREGSA